MTELPENYAAMEKKLEERVSLMVSRMTMREPFIAAVITKVKRQFVPGGTAGTDGSTIRFGVLWCSELTDKQLMFLCMHEAMHVVLMHSWRRGNRNPAKYNIAADAVINKALLDKGYEMPEGGVMIPWVGYEHDTETVYAKLPNPPEQPSGGSGGQGEGDDQGEGGEGGEGDADEAGGDGGTGGGTGGGGWDGTGDLFDADGDASAADMEATIMTAARMAKACGDHSAMVERILNGGLEPKANWSDVLRHIMTAAARNDYTYRRVNKRFIGSGIYMPSLWSESIGGLVVGIDTSGSMGQRELDQIASEIKAITEDTNPEWIEVVYCDTRVNHVDRFQQGDDIKLQAHGGGGTAFHPVFEHIEKMGEQVAALVYFTDLCGNVDCIDQPSYPVLWGVTYGHYSEVPFGEVVEVVV